VAFYENVAAIAMFPAVIHPSRVLMRRRDPHTRHPNMGMSIPAMISTLIHPSSMRRPATHFDNIVRRSNSYNDFLSHRANRHDGTHCCRQQNFSEHKILLS
jgi:hypothetical protein